MARSLDFIGGECPVEYQSYRTVPIGDFCINRKNSAWSFSDRTEKVKFESGENHSHFSARLEMQAPHDAMHRASMGAPDGQQSNWPEMRKTLGNL